MNVKDHLQPAVAPGQSLKQRPENLFVRTDVALAGLGDHLGRHRWWRRSLVPARRLCPVAHRLLVERRRRGAGVPGLGRPEPAGVRRQDLVADDQLAVDEAQLELGVGDHDAALERQLGRRPVGAEADSRARLATSSPTSSADCSNEMFSSWPSVAFVDGVNIGSRRRADSSNPAGNGAPCIVWVSRYSFHAEPVM